MSETDQLRKVWCFLGWDGDDPHGIILELSDEDSGAYNATYDKDERLSRSMYGTPVVVTHQGDGRRYVLRSAPCGLGCRCAAQAIPLEDAGRVFVGEDCTLDGKPATIIGRQLEHGIVAQYPQGLRVEYAWPTIARIMVEQEGRFRS